MSIVFAVIGLEISIAFLQAYVFVVLITIYLKDLIHTH
jgi:F0F1-type ATP synthase membrane subunit a